MRVALGTTVLERGMRTDGHLDGIGVYTDALIGNLPHCGVEIERWAFRPLPVGRPGVSAELAVNLMPGAFGLNVVRSALTGRPFPTPSWRGRIDLFHATDHLIPKLRGIPVLANLMDPVALMRPDWIRPRFSGTKSYLFRRSAQWADHYLAISNFVVPDLAEHFRIDEDRITSIHLGVAPFFFECVGSSDRGLALARWGIPEGFVLFVGTLQPRKNVATLIDAFETLPLEFRRAHPLVVAGRQGWGAETDVARLKKLEANGTGRWLRYVTTEEKRILLQSAAVLTFPSLYEGFGLPIVEAFASGLPVVASNSTSIPEIAGDAAILVDPLDAEALAHAIRTVIDSPDRADEMAMRGRARARHFTWRETARATAELYRRFA